MDDVLSGASTEEKATRLRKEVSELLKKGQFHLRKWRTNSSRILSDINEVEHNDKFLKLDKEGALKVLGLLWEADTDTIQYSVDTSEQDTITRRIIVSQVAQIYDPLGLLGPVLIQGNQSQNFDLVGFGDASERAYGACLYAISENDEGKRQSVLICSKSKIAPLKTTSIPRLELNAALMLSKLTTAVVRAFGDRIKQIHLWSDSSIVLYQIKTSPNLLKTYVANRVAKIQEWLKGASLTVSEWKNNSLWWHGPTWIIDAKKWPKQILSTQNSEQLEFKRTVAVVQVQSEYSLLRRYSSYDKLLRITAYLLRFKENCKQSNRKMTGPLAVNELNQAEIAIIKLVQAEASSIEITALINKRAISNSSKLIAFHPFLDKVGILRVGGRLRHAHLSEDQKHPVILPSKNPVTTLIIRKEHKRLNHSSTNQLLYVLRQRFWILQGRKEVKKMIKGCMTCFHLKPESRDILMGALPKERICGSLRAFVNTGTDYAGPFLIRERRRRGRPITIKAWIVIFLCCATKAVHLELVSELTTEAFLAALRRFVARRGICKQILSDNGTNYVGAERHLREVYEFLQKEQDTITRYLTQQRIQWQFMPPRAPNFGGLWEAAVKVVKKHFYAVTQKQLLTFEEFYSILTEIEAIMNSRPLCPMSEDPQDLTVITPAHFLVGDSLILPVEENFAGTFENRLSRWQLLQKMRQSLWARWQTEYLQELQRRHKWIVPLENLRPGMLVLLKEKNLPPLQWETARITELHCGSDNIARVVTVKTHKGLLKRAARGVCPLPLYDSE
ncbi:PREDICTED: uncharacterized protein LOC108779991 [Cyphomyrmex costatus]|uniref:uncharacterized protein LOC108779991 n=1 Tax=Cyphomyrmex costatus TaxID=456900 RepID=UPI0008523212|nr:PREDICTED: uncharacterized protein LOC108779991 [Cyphomyrmex costatus]